MIFFSIGSIIVLLLSFFNTLLSRFLESAVGHHQFFSCLTIFYLCLKDEKNRWCPSAQYMWRTFIGSNITLRRWIATILKKATCIIHWLVWHTNIKKSFWNIIFQKFPSFFREKVCTLILIPRFLVYTLIFSCKLSCTSKNLYLPIYCNKINKSTSGFHYVYSIPENDFNIFETE